MLNGSHSYLAYAGLLAGHTFVHEAIADPELRRCTRGLMREAALSLPAEMHGFAENYANDLIARFDNKSVNHVLQQIAMDGSEKVPYRLLDTIRENQKNGAPVTFLANAVRAWLDFVIRESEQSRPLQDPRSNELAASAQHHREPCARLASISPAYSDRDGYSRVFSPRRAFRALSGVRPNHRRDEILDDNQRAALGS